MILEYLRHLWAISLEASPYLMFGFFLGALIHYYVKPEWMTKVLGKGKVRSTLTAAAIGVPLPLCSCSVLPTAMAMQKKGATRGATMAFLISTPETGVDSILLTYGIMGPVMAVARPLAALVSAVMAGLLLECFPEKKEMPPEETKPCCGGSTPGVQLEIKLPCCGGAPAAMAMPVKSSAVRLRESAIGISRSFLTLFDDIAFWLFVGLSASALISAALPADLLGSQYGQGWSGMLLALLLGLPLYVCATASTPLAAALMGKGLSAGAALVFLLAGPATNIGAIGIVAKAMGKRGVFSYLFSIILVSLFFGWMVDLLYLSNELNQAHPHGHDHEGYAAVISAVAIWVLLAYSNFKHFRGKFLKNA